MLILGRSYAVQFVVAQFIARPDDKSPYYKPKTLL